MSIKAIAKQGFKSAVQSLGVKSNDARSLYVRDIDLTEATIEYAREDGSFSAVFKAVSAQDAIDTIKKLDALFL